MSEERRILENAVFIGGVPRSGTTFLARSLNSHPDFIVSADDHVLESWGLYYYRTRVGIVDGLRRGVMSREEALAALERHHFRDGRLLRVVPSEKTEGFPHSAPPLRPDGISLEGGGEIERLDVPVTEFSNNWRLVLKSPEITYALRDLATMVPSARFILVYRPLAEVAESMYRMGERVKKVKIFHRRWRDERGRDGRLIPPPGVPDEWAGFWHDVTDFQRCVINGASYLRALADEIVLARHKGMFFFPHHRLRTQATSLLTRLASFLEVDPHRFTQAAAKVRPGHAPLPRSLQHEIRVIREDFELDNLEAALEAASG